MAELGYQVRTESCDLLVHRAQHPLQAAAAETEEALDGLHDRRDHRSEQQHRDGEGESGGEPVHARPSMVRKDIRMVGLAFYSAADALVKIDAVLLMVPSKAGAIERPLHPDAPVPSYGDAADRGDALQPHHRL